MTDTYIDQFGIYPDSCFSVVLKGEINDIETNVLLDTGAGLSIIDIGTLERMNLVHQIAKTHKPPDCVDASGNGMAITGTIKLKTKLKGCDREIIHDFCVLGIRSYHSIIFGRDIMKFYKSVQFDFDRNRIRVGNSWLIPVSPDGKQFVRLCNNLTLKPRTEEVIEVRCNKTNALVCGEFVPKQIPGCHGVYVSKAQIIPDAEGHFLITVLNVNPQHIQLRKKQIIGCVRVGEKSLISNSTELNKVTIGAQLNIYQRQQVTDLLSEFENVFAINPKKTRQTNLTKHRIITGDAQAVYVKPRRIPITREKDVELQIDEMVRNGIRPSKSPWNAPIILVDKKDGSKRFVCDYRNLNHCTKKDTYPLPHVKDVIDRMHDSKYWSTLDAASAYWCIPVQENDKEKTAFSVKRGKFEFNVTPYGLCNAGASYQRLMDVTLSGLSADRILAYMDDIIVLPERLMNIWTVYACFSVG